MELHIHIDDGHKVKVKDLRGIEEGNWDTVYSVISRFAVDAEGNPIDPKVAEEMFSNLDIYECRKVTDQLREGLKALAFPLAAENN